MFCFFSLSLCTAHYGTLLLQGLWRCFANQNGECLSLAARKGKQMSIGYLSRQGTCGLVRQVPLASTYCNEHDASESQRFAEARFPIHESFTSNAWQPATGWASAWQICWSLEPQTSAQHDEKTWMKDGKEKFEFRHGSDRTWTMHLANSWILLHNNLTMLTFPPQHAAATDFACSIPITVILSWPMVNGTWWIRRSCTTSAAGRQSTTTTTAVTALTHSGRYPAQARGAVLSFSLVSFLHSPFSY